MSVCPIKAWSSGSESCMPRTMASRPSDSGRAYFSSIRSASWTISAISWSAWPRPHLRAPPPPGLPRDRRRRRRMPLGPRSAGSTTRRRCGPRGSPCAWPRALLTAPDVPVLCGACSCPEGRPARGPQGGGCLGPERGAEVVAPALGPELALKVAELLQQCPTTHLCLAPYALGLGDDGPVRFFPRGTEGPHQFPLLGQRTRPGLPQGRLAPCLPHPELQPLKLLAGDGVLGERRHPVLEVEGAEVPQLAPHRYAVARGLPRDPVDQQHPAWPLHGFRLPLRQDPRHTQDCAHRMVNSADAGHPQSPQRPFQASSPPSKQYAS